ncbi:FAD-dependent oxidoreductase [Telluria mixta]|uniref:FAD-dependent oxidoreductase n=1 Tax=Telluria mixta TaxID=34071 RepID=A0ABT2BZZ7_9BURK|nr:FAD-dependent oxidoreductase [Telluria mixta]MCS0630527.1 FAD-dependent oxidoreductase [Telluria mixta]WEM99395.1 FAD-dependent oxidoreductase [Telluria mixta]
MEEFESNRDDAPGEPALTRRGFLGMAASVAAAALPAAARAAVGQRDERGVLDIAIIGAGLAGLTAARDLRRAGCESFVLLEARDRVGGRTLNHDLGNGYFTEAGGQWIGPSQTAIADLARELGVGTFPSYWQGKAVVVGGDGRAAFDCDGTFGTDPKLGHELEEMAKSVPSGAPWTSPRAAEFDAMTLGSWLATKNVAPEDQISWQTGSVLTGGAAPSRLSLLHWLSMVNSAECNFERFEAVKDGAQGTRISGGSQILSIRMAQALGDKVRLKTPVLRIENWNDGPVAIHTPTGVIRARHVIVALSPPLCNQIAFDPPLPDGRREMQRRWPAYAPARKTAHVYKKPFWRDKGLNGWVMQPKGSLFWAYDNSPEDASFGVINAFVVNGTLPTDPKAAEAELSQIYAKALGEEALHPVAYYDHDWGQADPWTLTCISPMPPGFLTKYGQALHPPAGRLIWSGTETSDIWAGYMDGAVRSGHKAALQALQAINAGRA